MKAVIASKLFFFFFVSFVTLVTTTNAQSGDNDPCSICGEGKHATNLGEEFINFPFDIPGLEDIVTCGNLEFLGLTGGIDPLTCGAILPFIGVLGDNPCGCEDNNVCSICNVGLPLKKGLLKVGDPDAVPELPGNPLKRNCGWWETEGLAKKLTPAQCGLFTVGALGSCDCELDDGITDVGGDDSDLPCFSGENTVQVQGKGPTPMQSLQIGDYVRVDGSGGGGDKYSMVYSFGHRDTTTPATYLQIHAKGVQRPLEISREHMVYVGSSPDAGYANLQSVPAANVKVGDYVLVAETGDLASVVKLETVQRRGAFAPFTATGTILVSDILASNYIAYNDLPMTWTLQQRAAHAFNAPHRITCHFSLDYCKAETYQDGYSNWIVQPMRFMHWLMQQNVVFQAALVYGVAAPCFLAASLMESVLVSPGNALVHLAIVGGLIWMLKNAMTKSKKLV